MSFPIRPTRRPWRAAPLLALCAVAACGGGDGAPSAPAPAPPAPVARVTTGAAVDTVFVGDRHTLTAQPVDAAGHPLTGRPVAWSSAAPAVATVDGTGVVTGILPGQTSVTVTSEGQSSAILVVVLPQPVARVALADTLLTREIGDTITPAVRLYDRTGAPLTGRPVAWASSSPAVATVDAATGAVTAVAPGTATISATSEGRVAALQFVVLPPPPVARVVLAGASLSLDEGATAQLVATPFDSIGRPLRDRAIVWSSSAPAIATVALDGRVTAVAAGTATITATSEGRSATLAVTVTRVPVASIVLGVRTAQPALGDTVTVTAVAYSAAGVVLPGRAATFASDAPAVATVDPRTGLVRAVALGSATITATIEGKTQGVRLTVPPLAPPPATGTGTYAIDVRFVTTASADLQAVARQAAARWAQIVVAGLPAHRVDLAAGACDTGMPAIHETVQNLVVLVRIDAIDGPDGTVAYAGPCVLRDSPAGPGTGLPSVGAITLDSIDLRRMLNQGYTTWVQDVVTHEMGHILGVGTLWDPSWNPGRALVPLWKDEAADLTYIGGAAAQASAALGFTTAGAPVPVENLGGMGTRGSHWRESVFWTELMTGWINGRNSLSTVTVGALRDLGYTVSEARADPFSKATAPYAMAGARVSRTPDRGFQINERVFAPRRVRDASGRVRVVPPGVARAEERAAERR